MALGKGALCREPALQLSAKVPLCREPNGTAIGKGDDNGSRPCAAPSPRACLCQESSSRQSFPLPNARLCRELSHRQRLFAEGSFWLSAKAVFAEGRLSAKLGPRQSSRFL